MCIIVNVRLCTLQQRRDWRARLVMCRAAAVMLLASHSGSAPGQTIVALPDSSLSNAVRAALSKPGDPLTVTDLEGLTCLSACDRQITNLCGLDWATNLAGLYLNRNAISDLGPLRSLARLRSLELDQNQITDLSPLLGLTNLACLTLGGNPVSDFSVLSNLTWLSSLSVCGGSMTDLTVLQPANRRR